MNKLTKKELERIQELVNSFNKLKISLGDTVIQQNSLMSDISEMKAEYALEEQKLIKNMAKTL